jgi:hypothetical protein
LRWWLDCGQVLDVFNQQSVIGHEVAIVMALLVAYRLIALLLLRIAARRRL